MAANSVPGGTMPGVARNMPITAVNTMSDTTRGLVSARKARRRWAKLGEENLCIHREGRKPRKAKKFSTTSAASSAAAPALCAAASASGTLNATLAIPSENCMQQQRADE